MEYTSLFNVNSPLVFTISTNEDSFANLYNQLTIGNKNSVIRMLRGKKCKTTPDFFNEISAALQFPYYFGENGAALNDCLSDLDWLEGDSYLLMVNNSEEFLSGSENIFNNMLEIFLEVQKLWLAPNEYIPRDRKPTSFHLLFQYSSPDFIDRLKKSEIAFEQIP